MKFLDNKKIKTLGIFCLILLTTVLIIINNNIAYGQQIPDDPQEAILNKKMLIMEQKLEEEYETFFERNLVDTKQSSLEIANTLAKMDSQTGTNSAVIWVKPEAEYLHLVYLSKQGKIIVKDIEGVTLNEITKVIDDFYQEIELINNPMNLTQAQQLYEWIIKPYQQEYLDKENINNILFCISRGIRLIPLGILHDGKNFLIEKYNISRIPAFNLINTDYKPIKSINVLAMGAENFTDNIPLPGVSLELQNFQRLQNQLPQLFSSQILLNEEFTLGKMAESIETKSFNIVHLATHANFNPGDVSDSYIQFWDGKLTLDKMSSLPWQTPPDLLVLSACNTAWGDRNAQLGFTGIALQSGVNSALGSLWSVSDLGTYALIREFYEQLINREGENITKTEALRKAQNLLLQGKVYFEDNRLITPEGEMELPESLNLKGKIDLSHPFYWGGFTLISSPW